MLSATIKCTLTDGELLFVPGLVKAQAPCGQCDMLTKGAGMAGTAARVEHGRGPRKGRWDANHYACNGAGARYCLMIQ